MTRRRHPTTSHDAALARLVMWLALVLLGTVGGMLLGETVAGDRQVTDSAGGNRYADYSANPDAMTPEMLSSPPCFDCVDSYAAAPRLQAQRINDSSDAFRELGRVDVKKIPSDQFDEYQYGGRFPDPEPRAAISDRKPRTAPTPDPVAPSRQRSPAEGDNLF